MKTALSQKERYFLITCTLLGGGVLQGEASYPTRILQRSLLKKRLIAMENVDGTIVMTSLGRAALSWGSAALFVSNP